MSSTIDSNVADSAATIVEAFQDSDHPDLQGVSSSAVDRRLQSMVEYRVPVADAERAVVRALLSDLEIEREDIPTSVATLAGFSSRRSTEFDRAMISTLADANIWCDLLVEVVELWEPRSESIDQVGLIGDESGVIKFVKWASADLPALEEGAVYRLENVVSDEYKGRFSVNLNSASSVTPSDDSVDASDGTIEAAGSVVAVQEGSGLIKRCPEADCTRVRQNGRCAEHGQVDGEFDLRIKAILDDGSRAVNVIFDAEATEEVAGITLKEAKQMAMDALDTDVVADEIRDQILGRTYTVTGPVVGSYLLVNDSAETPGATVGLDHADLEPAVSNRQAAKRVLPAEFNAATHEFTQSDEERAPQFNLLPTGEAVNRVLVVGTLIETEDVGRDDEYWKGRIVAGNGSVFVYAGQYEPDAAAVLREAETPCYVAVVGKPRTYESGDYVNVSIRPEALAIVDEETRDAWHDVAVSATRERLAAFTAGEAPYADLTTEVYHGEEISVIEETHEELERVDESSMAAVN